MEADQEERGRLPVILRLREQENCQAEVRLAGWSRQREAVKWYIAQNTIKNTTITLMGNELRLGSNVYIV